MKIIVCGYMGSGKTTVGKLLAEKLRIPFFDLDDLIEINERKDIKSIFLENGEIYFRRVESEVLHQFISSKANFVLALGGGTPCYANNSNLLQNEDVQSYYLKASVETLLKRLENQRKNRPLLSNLDTNELNDYIRKHLFDRNYYYLQSKHIITVDDKTENEIVAEINKTLF